MADDDKNCSSATPYGYFDVNSELFDTTDPLDSTEDSTNNYGIQFSDALAPRSISQSTTTSQAGPGRGSRYDCVPIDASDDSMAMGTNQSTQQSSVDSDALSYASADIVTASDSNVAKPDDDHVYDTYQYNTVAEDVNAAAARTAAVHAAIPEPPLSDVEVKGTLAAVEAMGANDADHFAWQKRFETTLSMSSSTSHEQLQRAIAIREISNQFCQGMLCISFGLFP
jgi:hypothetical protein